MAQANLFNFFKKSSQSTGVSKGESVVAKKEVQHDPAKPSVPLVALNESLDDFEAPVGKPKKSDSTQTSKKRDSKKSNGKKSEVISENGEGLQVVKKDKQPTSGKNKKEEEESKPCNEISYEGFLASLGNGVESTQNGDSDHVEDVSVEETAVKSDQATKEENNENMDEENNESRHTLIGKKDEMECKGSEKSKNVGKKKCKTILDLRHPSENDLDKCKVIESESEEATVEESQPPPAPKCHAITKFFSKAPKPKVPEKKKKKAESDDEDGEVVVVNAMVHSLPSPMRPCDTSPPSKSSKKSNVAVGSHDVDMSITLLSSTVIKEKEKIDTRKRIIDSDDEAELEKMDTRKRIIDSDDEAEPEKMDTRKRIIESDEEAEPESNEQASSDHNSTSVNLVDHSSETVESTPVTVKKIDDEVVDGARNDVKLDEVKAADVTDRPTVLSSDEKASKNEIKEINQKLPNSTKKKQATLSFGKSGSVISLLSDVKLDEVKAADVTDGPLIPSSDEIKEINQKLPNSTKKKQATLSFGKSGSVVSLLSPVTPVVEDDTSNTKSSEGSLRKSKRRLSLTFSNPLSKRKKKAEHEEGDSEVEVVTKRPTLRRRSSNLHSHEERENDSPRKKALTNVYESEVTSKRSPLKLKFTRIKTFGNENQDEKKEVATKKQKAIKKAQQLLSRAKSSSYIGGILTKGKRKKTEDDDVLSPPEKDSNRRHSARLRTRKSLEPICLSGSESEEEQIQKRKKPRTEEKILESDGKKALKVASKIKNKSVKNAPSALAPIFKSKAVVQETAKVDPEKMKIRRAFLLSGVPENLKKDSCEVYVERVLDYPPFPSISHVTQYPKGFERLCSPVFPLKLSVDTPTKISHSSHWEGLQKLRQSQQTVDTVKRDLEKCQLAEDAVKYLLAEIYLQNPSFPVRRMYNLLKKKLNGGSDNQTDGEKKSQDKKNNNKKDNRERRRSSRNKRQSLEADHVIVGEETNKNEKEDEKADTDLEKCLMWTDKYKPSASSEIVGNQKSVKRMKCWLEEWKQKTDLEIKKLKKQLRKDVKTGKTSKEEAQKALGCDWWTDDESDFDLDLSDEEYSDPEDDGLCNTMLITGPRGIGKTALVYALANELGYKVFEVNASSRRNGKQILSQLQEATQSHQVSKAHLDTSVANTMSNIAPKAAPVQKKVPTAFTSFFKKETPVEKKKGSNAAGKPKEKSVVKKLDMSKSESKKGLNLSSTSVILFEEVDIVFEEDKGFWHAVQTFISTTKRPIILTTNDSNLSSKFEVKMEHLPLHVPSPASVASYLQTICLVENIRTDFEDLSALASLHHCDLRQCLLNTQFWVLSGGSTNPTKKVIQYSKEHHQRSCLNPNLPSSRKILLENRSTPTKKEVDSSDEFSTSPLVRKKRVAGNIPSSPLMGSPGRSTPTKNGLLGLDESSQGFDSPRQKFEVGEVQGASVHQCCSEHCIGLSSQSLVRCFKDANFDPETLTKCRKINFNAVYSNIPHLLPLKKNIEALPIHFLEQPNYHICDTSGIDVTSSRIKNRNDLYDSEASEDEATTPKLEIKSEDSHSGKPCEAKLSKAEHTQMRTAMEALSGLYDNISLVDTWSHASGSHTIQEGACYSKWSEHHWQHATVNPGDTDNVITFEEWDARLKQSVCDISSNIEVLTLKKCQEELGRCNKMGDSSGMVLPVEKDSQGLCTTLERKEQLSSAVMIKKAIDNLVCQMPLGIECQRRGLALDYLPTVRCIAKSEQFRQATQAKRRFLHYLTQVSFKTLKKNSLENFCASFT